jgi:hypothetical protein
VKIPRDLEECIKKVEVIAPQVIKMFKDCDDECITASYHFSLGRYLRNNWGLWKTNKLTKYFNDMGITHPDDMSGIILISTYRSLHSQDIKLKKQVKYYQDYWKKQGYKNGIPTNE